MMRYSIFLICFIVSACSEAPIFTDDGIFSISAPIDIVQVPGTDVGLVLNSNVNLTRSEGSIMVLDLLNHEIVLQQSVAFPSFGSKIAVDVPRQQIYVGDRANDVVQVFSYDLGSGGASEFSISPKTVDASQSISNAFKADEEPFDIQLYTDANSEIHGIYTSSLEGTVVFFNLDNFNVLDLFANDQRVGLPLIGITSLNLNSTLLGVGASHIAIDPSNERFAYIVSGRNNFIFTVDLIEKEIEQVFSLVSYFPAVGLRDLTIDSNQNLYFLHQANDSLNKIDISQVTNNGVAFEESPVHWVNQASLPGGPESIVLSPDEQQVWVTLYGINEVWVFNANTLEKIAAIPLEGNGPAALMFSEDGAFVYVCQFLSNSISVINAATMQQSIEIQ